MPGCAMGGPSGRPVAASQSRAVLSKLPVRIVLPSGLNATDVHGPECSRGGPTGRPVAASHSRAVLSLAPGEDRLAVGAERHRDHDRPDAPWAGRWAGRWRRPTAAPSCRRLPVRSVLPSGLNATRSHRARMLHGWAEGPAGGGVPQPRRLVIAPGEDRLAVRAQCHGRDFGIPAPRAGREARPDATSQRRTLPSRPAVRRVLPSGLNATAAPVASVLQRPADGLTDVAIPERAVPSVTAGEDRPAVGAERHGPDLALMLQGRADRLTGGGVPQLGRVVRHFR